MKYADLIDHVNAILGEYKFPLTIRQIYYRLVASFGLPNKRAAYNQLSSQLVKARELGDVDEDRIEDRSRGFLGGDYGFNDPKEFVKEIFNRMTPSTYTRKMWDEQEQFVVVWIEKDALSRVVSRITNQFNVLTAPSRGYASYSYIKDALTRLPFDKPVAILHFADHDPSGIDMSRDLQERFNRYSFNGEIEVKRVALTHNQVLSYNLQPNPTKMADTRSEAYANQFGNECWELDAIDPSELQRIVRTAIKSFIDVEAWNTTIEETKKDRIQLKKMLNEMKKAIPFDPLGGD